MLNFHIRKVTLQSGDTRYRTIITKSGKSIKTKTFRRKADAKTWGSRTVLEYQENEAKGIKPCTITFSRLADEYMHWWTGKDHDRVRLVLWWKNPHCNGFWGHLFASADADAILPSYSAPFQARRKTSFFL